MKKYILGLILFSCLLGCSKEEAEPEKSTGLTEEQQFRSVLTAKKWVVTKYEYQDEQNPDFPMRDFYKNSVPTRKLTLDPDPCGWSGIKTSPVGIWKTYEVRFTESSTIGTFSYGMRKVDWDTAVTNTVGCKIGYKTTDHVDNVTNDWSYNPATKMLTTNFGEPYEILDGQKEYFQIDYKVVSFDANKIVLEGKRSYEDEPFLTNNIILE